MIKTIFIDNKLVFNDSFLKSNLSNSEITQYKSRKTNSAKYDFLIGRIALKKAYSLLNKSKKEFNLIDVKCKISKVPYI